MVFYMSIGRIGKLSLPATPIRRERFDASRSSKSCRVTHVNKSFLTRSRGPVDLQKTEEMYIYIYIYIYIGRTG